MGMANQRECGTLRTPSWLRAGGDETVFPELQVIASASGSGGGGKLRCVGLQGCIFVPSNAALDHVSDKCPLPHVTRSK